MCAWLKTWLTFSVPINQNLENGCHGQINSSNSIHLKSISLVQGCHTQTVDIGLVYTLSLTTFERPDPCNIRCCVNVLGWKLEEFSNHFC